MGSRNPPPLPPGHTESSRGLGLSPGCFGAEDGVSARLPQGLCLSLAKSKASPVRGWLCLILEARLLSWGRK